jgi:hypothetical protein
MPHRRRLGLCDKEPYMLSFRFPRFLCRDAPLGRLSTNQLAMGPYGKV